MIEEAEIVNLIDGLEEGDTIDYLETTEIYIENPKLVEKDELLDSAIFKKGGKTITVRIDYYPTGVLGITTDEYGKIRDMG